MSRFNKAPGVKTFGTILGAVGLLAISGCTGTDYKKVNREVRLGIDCTSGDEIIMTNVSSFASKKETPSGDKDMSNFRLKFFCESGSMAIKQLADKVGPEGQRPHDNVITIKTEDKTGTRTNDSQTIGYASPQTVKLDHQPNTNYAEITLLNADHVVSGYVATHLGEVTPLSFDSLNPEK